MLKPIAAVIFLLAGSAAFDEGVWARDKSRSGQSLAKACSRYGNGCVSGAVRPARYGQQVRLKSGTWIDCKGDCGRTLLEETVDFWDSQAEKALIAVP